MDKATSKNISAEQRELVCRVIEQVQNQLRAIHHVAGECYEDKTGAENLPVLVECVSERAHYGIG